MSRICSIASVTVVFVALNLLSLTAATSSRGSPLAHNTDDAVQLAENNIACNRRGCHTLRAGCRIVRAPHPRDNRRVCSRPARA